MRNGAGRAVAMSVRRGGRSTPTHMAEQVTDRGSTLVEALVATLVLTTGLLAMAELVRVADGSNVMARNGTVAGILAEQKIEQLRALAWEFDASGVPVSDADTDTTFCLNHRRAEQGCKHLRIAPAKHAWISSIMSMAGADRRSRRPDAAVRCLHAPMVDRTDANEYRARAC